MKCDKHFKLNNINNLFLSLFTSKMKNEFKLMMSLNQKYHLLNYFMMIFIF
jgi:hypothetical protein